MKEQLMNRVETLLKKEKLLMNFFATLFSNVVSCRGVIKRLYIEHFVLHDTMVIQNFKYTFVNLSLFVCLNGALRHFMLYHGVS